MIDRAIYNHTPLAPNFFAPLPVGAVRPEGWLKETEQAVADSLSKQTGENGVRMEALVPLAWQLEEEKLKEEAQHNAEQILASQREDGSFGAPQDDWWPRMQVLRWMAQFFAASGDKRVLRFMERYFEYQYKVLEEKPLGRWAVARAGETMQVAQWLYNLTGAKGLLKLCDQLLEQSIDWTGYFHTFPDARDQKRAFPWTLLRPMLEKDTQVWSAGWQQHQRTHAVNVAMGLKTPALDHALHGGIKQAQAFDMGWKRLMHAHGVANGMFTGDEHLSGNNPSQGMKNEAVVEMLTTLELLMAQREDAFLGDLWERIAYNALPAAFSADGKAAQDVQQVNQIRIDRQRRDWYNSNADANVFCTDGMEGLRQGWPKFTAQLWMVSRDGGLCAQSYAPCQVRWKIGDTRVRLIVEGGYPFAEEIRITVRCEKPTRFPIRLRIPGWTDDAYAEVDGQTYVGQSGEFLLLDREWKSGDVIVLFLAQPVYTEAGYHQSAAVYRGPVLYALPVQANWTEEEGIRRAEPKSAWNYALLLGRGIEIGADGKSLKAQGFRCEGWTEKEGSAGPIPVCPLYDGQEIEPLTLVPYACAPLRIAQFPQGCEKQEENRR